MDVSQLEGAEEITMRTKRRDGSWSSRPIWVVVVDGDAYVRSAKGTEGAWYRRARADGTAEIGVDGETVGVRMVPVDDDGLDERVSDAYRAKYGAQSPESTEAMLGDEVRATTMQVVLP